MDQDVELRAAWTKYALTRIQKIADKPREKMTDDDLSIYSFAANALAGGDPVIALFERGPGFRLCRVCGAEWSETRAAEHISGCPIAAMAANRASQ